MSKFISTMMTEAPFSRAAIAAGSPPAPRADDDDVGLAVPGDGIGGVRRLLALPPCGDGAGRGARRQKAAPAQ